jgi:hypothetical protein
MHDGLPRGLQMHLGVDDHVAPRGFIMESLPRVGTRRNA